MQAAQFVSGLFILLIAIIITCDARVVGLCRHHISCGDECDECLFGSKYIEECRVRVCSKGPGDRCGNRYNMWGVCGNGLMCQCYQCHGCSTVNVAANCSNIYCPPTRQIEWPGYLLIQRLDSRE